MNIPQKRQFHIVLNLSGLTPRDPAYWKEKFGQIRADLANEHEIYMDGWIGSYVGKQAFFLFAGALALDNEEDMKIYREADEKVRAVIEKYVKANG